MSARVAGKGTLALLGGSGFFGKSFLDAFQRGLLAPWSIDRVIVMARRPQVLVEEHPELVTGNVELLALDIAEARSLPAAEYLLHAANTTDARRYQQDPLAERAQILGAARTFATLASAHPTMRIVYASSGAVYGAQASDVAETAELHDVTGLTAYKRDYAEAKRAAEAIIAGLGRDHGMAVSVARCFAFIGRFLPRDQHFAIGNFLADGLAGRPIRVAARHPVIRSYMHADDLVRWLMTIAANASPDCPIYNVGSAEGVDVADLARRVAARFGVSPAISFRAEQPIDRYVPCIDKAARELGLVLDRDLDRALDETIASIRHELLVSATVSATPPTNAAAPASATAKSSPC